MWAEPELTQLLPDLGGSLVYNTQASWDAPASLLTSQLLGQRNQPCPEALPTAILSSYAPPTELIPCPRGEGENNVGPNGP